MIQRMLRWTLEDQDEQQMTELVVSIAIICFIAALMVSISHRYLDVSRLTEAHIWSGVLRADYHLGLIENNLPDDVIAFQNQARPSSIEENKPINDRSFALHFSPELFHYPISKITWQLTNPNQSINTNASPSQPAYQWLNWQCQLHTPPQTMELEAEPSLKKQLIFASMLLCPLQKHD